MAENVKLPDGWAMCSPGRQCPKCGSCSVKFRTHESSCGGYEDDEFKCQACKHTWWVDGIDS